MKVTSLRTNNSGVVTFGTYSDDNWLYFGTYCSNGYSYARTVTLLSADSGHGDIQVYDGGDTQTKPTGWTAVTIDKVAYETLVPEVHSGSAAPANTLGKNGDIYVQTS